ncbi:MAG TPA: hypothetical protein VGG46_05170 [Terriglobales bacterium]|jgi:predicted transcriptional regulator
MKSTESRDARTALLLSIRPEHSHRIFAGSKRFELRKVIPAVPFKRVFLYETGGAGIVGWFDVGRVFKQPITKLWKTVGTAATSRERFLSYFSSTKEGFAIAILNAHRFKTSISITELNGDAFKLQPPQSFIILQPSAPLFALLEAARQQTLKIESPKVVSLRRITRAQREAYTSLVTRHVGANYDGIDEGFAKSNLRIHDLGFDPSGFFTTSKEVLGIHKSNKSCIGFTTLTHKSGGCVKTGPTVLLPQYRSKGYGQATRKEIEDYVVRHKARKLYCTCPDTSIEVMRYLLAAGMRVEAHLANHYSTSHGEFVLGKLLTIDETGTNIIKPTKNLHGDIIDPALIDRNQLVRDFKEMFERIWREVPEHFVRGFLKQSIEEKATEHHRKPKRLVCLGKEGHVFGAVALLPKRGGAVKGLLLRNTSNGSSVKKMVDASFDMVSQLGGRKLYFLHPIADSETILLLKLQGFQAEGFLLAPYVPGQDVVVMSRFV